MVDEKLESWIAKTLGETTEHTRVPEAPLKKLENAGTAQTDAKPRGQNGGGHHKQGGKPFFKRGGGHTGHGNRQNGPRPTIGSTSVSNKGLRPAPHFSGKPGRHGVLRCIPLGGLGEVGKNMMVYEYNNEIVIIDMGFQFPEEDMLGVDYVIPDISYLADKAHKIRGILITHGHLDHIGAIPYLLPKLGFPPIYGAKLAIALVKKRLEEFNLLKQAKLHVIDPKDHMKLGQFDVDWFRVNHSIPDSCGIVLSTPAGKIVNTGDFKFDYTPVHQHHADYSKIAALSSQGIDALFSDSTNALKPGHTLSEKKIGETLDGIISGAKGRIIIAAFSSLIGRIQYIVNAAERAGRKVYISGRSMSDNIQIAQELSFIKAPPGLIMPINKMGRIKDEHCLIITTGAQGEAVSALARMSIDDHQHIRIKKGDTIILSSSPIPGNERAIFSVINNLIRLGAKVIFNQVMDVHTSGHAAREDLQLMIQLVKPRALVPIHGELYMLHAHTEIGQSLGMKESNTIMLENGDVLEIKNGEVIKTGEKVSANPVMIDGKGVGDSAQIMVDRQAMSENGVLIVVYTVKAGDKTPVRDPDIITRGFIYMAESEAILKETIALSKKAYTEACHRIKTWKRGEIKAFISGQLSRFTHRRLDRQPLIMPIIIEV